MYRNYGDRNFFEVGILVDSEHSDTEFDMLLCRPYDDCSDMYQFAHVTVDISASWIDRKSIMEFSGLTEEDFDPVQFAIGCTDFYSWDNFGADSYGVTYDWRHMDRLSIEEELRHYMIASDNLDMPWKEPKTKVRISCELLIKKGYLTELQDTMEKHIEYLIDYEENPDILDADSGKVEVLA